ncbi:MAG: hypothetical protein CM15mP128_4010 [Methanobacteriota archaeon]|nr:MAG: hypothetical protein CM15mP128_4010 [Euryarchaeota archaeon]
MLPPRKPLLRIPRGEAQGKGPAEEGASAGARLSRERGCPDYASMTVAELGRTEGQGSARL